MNNYLARYTSSAETRTKFAFLLSGFLLISFAVPAIAGVAGESGQIDWLKLGMGLFGGLAMFLFGMEQMSDGLKSAAGDTLKDVLAKLTKNRFMGALTGAFVTAVLNSSSVTTVLVVGFISAGFMTLAQSVGVIMGANIGSTVTAQIVAFNVTQYALILVAVGFFMLFAAKQEKTKYYGMMIMGLGLVFYGMGVMGDAMTPLRSYQPFLDLMVKMENPLLGILVGAIFTGLVQSSAATTGIAIVMATGGLISLPAGIALAFGANIGTCVTALLASMGKPVEAKRAAMVHVLFNVAGVILWVMFIPQLAEFIVAVSPSSPELTGKARMAADVPRQIANAHTVFNIANTLIFLGFTTYFARLAERLVPEKVVEEKVIIEPRFLDMDVVGIPALALEQTRFEIGHMGEIVKQMYADIRLATEEKDLSMLDDVRKLDDKVDVLHERILEYLSEIRQEPLTDQQSDTFQALMSATINLENLADVIETELVDILSTFINMNTEASEATRLLIHNLYDTVNQSLHDLMKAIREDDEIAAQDVLIVKEEISRIANDFLSHQSERIGVQTESHLDLVRLEMELLDKLRQIYTLAKRIAKDFVPTEVAENA
ncbi:MAG: Na/Pi cotransporter family protein [Gammaproteobacteria bacterium]|nr:Na/Pi cotransporter family protein [Gammaproteobacteria bacterium]